MTISDSLDMVGVVLKSTWVQTRKANGEIVQARVSNTVNAWKSLALALALVSTMSDIKLKLP